jgi:hypothetical protein
VQLLDEAFGAHVDARAHAHLLQKGHEPVILAGVVIRQHFAHVARVGQALALGHAQEQAREPVREIAADEEKMIVFELVKELLRRQVLALQRADELQQILIGDHVGRRGGDPAEEVVDDRALQTVALGPVGR